MTQAKNERHITVVAEASSLEKWRKQVIAGQPETGRSYAFISDEGSYMPGGEGTAPTPLTYFVSGIALWLISHVSQVAAKTKMEIRNERVKVTAHFYEAGSVLRGDAFGEARRFEIELSMESDAPVEQVKKLMTLAHRMCFTEAALQGGVEISSENRLNGEPLPLDKR